MRPIWKLCIQLDGLSLTCVMDGKWFHEGHKERGVTLPILLLIDGAKSHFSIHASEFCHKNDIILYVLYPTTTHLIQPMDLILLNSIKTVYKEEV